MQYLVIEGQGTCGFRATFKDSGATQEWMNARGDKLKTNQPPHRRAGWYFYEEGEALKPMVWQVSAVLCGDIEQIQPEEHYIVLRATARGPALCQTDGLDLLEWLAELYCRSWNREPPTEWTEYDLFIAAGKPARAEGRYERKFLGWEMQP